MGHVAPVVASIVIIARRRVRIIKDETEDSSTVNDGVQVIDLCRIGRIPASAPVRGLS